MAVLVEAFTDRDWKLSGFEWPADFLTAALSDAPHKLSIVRGKVAVEFVYLDLDRTTGSSIRYHETVCPARKRYMCDESVFSERSLKICGVNVRVPESEYLPSVFGPRWRENRKGTGGVEV